MASFSTLATLRQEARRRLGSIDAGKLKPSEQEEDDSIRDALNELNRIGPQLFVFEKVGDGAARRFPLASTITGTPGWDDQTSELQDLELVSDPNTDSEHVRAVDDEDWSVRLDSSDELVLWLRTAVGTTEYLRVFWSLPHRLSGLDSATETTIQERWKALFLLLVLAELSDLISRKASDLADHTTGVEQVDFRTFEERWKSNADRLRARAAERINPNMISAAAGTATEWETRNRFGLRRISH